MDKNEKIFYVLLLFIIQLTTVSCLAAHEFRTELRYLGNEAVMVTDGSNKVLFDPFFHNNYNIYTLVPDKIRHAIFNGEPPYDNINALFISHAHGDHFAANDVLRFLIHHQQVQLVAPKQAIDQILALPNASKVKSRLYAINLDYGEKPGNLSVGSIEIEAVRIPHAGWPDRAEIENIVFRLTLGKNLTVMHLGDADPDDNHFLPHKKFWQHRVTDYALPPYWFMQSKQGRAILDQRINSLDSIGIHVPMIVPESLLKTGRKYFSKPGETKKIDHQH